jgi:hypothetical protein
VQAPRAQRRRNAYVRILDAPFLDRLLRGRVWIGIVAFALLGIVAMQVAILRLGASIGASVTEIQALQQSNQNTETAIARLEPGVNVAGEAAALGMVYPPAGNVDYLRWNAGDARIGADSITAPTAPVVSAAAPGLTAPLSTSSATSTSAASTGSAATTPTTPSQQGGTTSTTNAAGGAVSAPPADAAAGSTVGAGGGSTAPGATGG